MSLLANGFVWDYSMLYFFCKMDNCLDTLENLTVNEGLNATASEKKGVSGRSTATT